MYCYVITILRVGWSRVYQTSSLFKLFDMGGKEGGGKFEFFVKGYCTLFETFI